ncbi:MAG: hypothetical protein JRF33_19200 [Deltaproteobacteria bacterium]|nr:hypothetical protein [Deltaproteobacteria bacterium]
MTERFVLGVDGGGTKTLALVADSQGRVLGMGRAGSSNYQDCGRAGAEKQIRRALDLACRNAGIATSQLEAACLGLSGADRPRDFEFIRGFLDPLLPGLSSRLVNDSLIALRAGTEDGVGIALVAGTGSNVIGRNAEGQTLQVGGLGPLSGDRGSAPQIGQEAVVAAIMGQDGRGAATVLTARIMEKLSLDRLDDIIELEFFDNLEGRLNLGFLAPLVFEAAASGDVEAQRILVDSGHSLAGSAAVIASSLFSGEQTLRLVFGGSVLQKGASPLLIETVVDDLRQVCPGLKTRILDLPPVAGAVLFALDDLGLRDTGLVEALRAGIQEAKN